MMLGQEPATFNVNDVAIWGIMILLVVGKVLDTLKGRGIDLKKLCDQTSDLHRWHNKDDADGVKVWYIRKSFSDSVEKLASAIKVLASLAEQQKIHNDAIKGQLGRIEKEVRK